MANSKVAPIRYTAYFVSGVCLKNPAGIRTHGFLFAQDTQYQIRLDEEENDQEDQRYQLIENVESNVPVRIVQGGIEVAGPSEGCIKSDVASPDEKQDGSD